MCLKIVIFLPLSLSKAYDDKKSSPKGEQYHRQAEHGILPAEEITIVPIRACDL